jgi:hypothetical protein
MHRNKDLEGQNRRIKAWREVFAAFYRHGFDGKNCQNALDHVLQKYVLSEDAKLVRTYAETFNAMCHLGEVDKRSGQRSLDKIMDSEETKNMIYILAR